MYHAESRQDVNGKPEYSEKHEIAFIVGSGDVGRSYLIIKGDALFLSPISYTDREHAPQPLIRQSHALGKLRPIAWTGNGKGSPHAGLFEIFVLWFMTFLAGFVANVGDSGPRIQVFPGSCALQRGSAKAHGQACEGKSKKEDGDRSEPFPSPPFSRGVARLSIGR